MFNHAKFQLAATHRSQWPQESIAEIAFAGRSNVGKSSAINAITGRQKLARTSKTPGRTQQIVFFRLLDDKYLADLPGYGYAKAPIRLRQQWETFITDYLYHRAILKVLCIAMDIRRPLTPLDRTMLDICRNLGLHAHILLTKADKFKSGRAKTIFHQVQNEITSQQRVSAQLFSAKTGLGIHQAQQTLQDFLDSDQLPKSNWETA